MQRDRDRGQMSFFGSFDQDEAFKGRLEDVPELEEWPEHQLLAYERAVLGFYVSSHPNPLRAEDHNALW